MSLQEKLNSSAMGKIRVNASIVNYEKLSELFQDALVWYESNLKGTVVIESLVTPTGNSVERSCPRDVQTATLIKNSEMYKGWEICKFCENCLTCAVDGRTKQFKLLESYAHSSVFQGSGEK